jgi:4a-hydroxytetrahydrobiopterin dehydratase
MTTPTSERPDAKTCPACEGNVARLSPEQAQDALGQLSGWCLTEQSQRIRKDWKVKNFRVAMAFLNRVAELAEQEGHHPDLHLTGYRHVWIEIWTHSIGGLSEYDLALAAKIDGLPSAST